MITCEQDKAYLDERNDLKEVALSVFLFLQYLRGADPVLKFLDENNKVIETLSIEKWNTDSVDEFLMERLKPSH